MIRDFREKYNISETDLTNEISNRLSDIDISLDSNSKKYNLKTINELLVQQKLLTNLKNKIDNNEEVYVRKEQQGGVFSKNVTDSNHASSIPSGSKAALVILDLQSVLKYKPSGNAVVDENALDALDDELKEYSNSVLHIICDDNWTWNDVIERIPKLDKWTVEDRFHCANGFTNIKKCVKKILNMYNNWLDKKHDNTHIYYLSRNWNKDKQVSDLNNETDLNLTKDSNNSNIYNDNIVKVEFMDKDKISTSSNYMDQLPNVRSIRESMNNTKWISPFLIHRDHFKSMMTRLRVHNGNLQRY